ncbi:MAG: hypothetical protein IJD04_00580, partial [Desulfovibrionaceae bacterium]|nr:hypothetical protein [Desulfovibrionaceae bacterium]
MDSAGNGLSLLFLHQNFPSQYFHIARRYASDPANTVVAVGEEINLRRNPALPGVRYVPYALPQDAAQASPAT